jgi:hypothetical protein
MDPSSYKEALSRAIRDWRDLARQENEIAIRKAQLKRTIKALRALCAELPDVNSLSLSDAIRLMIHSSTAGLSPIEIRTKLRDLGYDLSKFKTPMASIHTAVNRMLESEELVKVPDPDQDEEKEKIEAGKNFKVPTLPEPSMSGLNTSVLEMLASLNKKEEKK